MTEAFDYPARAVAADPAARLDRPGPGLGSICGLLTEGGDARIALDPKTARNKYGCAAAPEAGVTDFASSTASSISPRGFAAAEALRRRLAQAEGRERRAVTYGRELDRMRGDLAGLCGLGDMAGLDIVFAASGTDLHLLVSALVGGAAERPLVCIDVEAEETGSGVPDALSGRHFSTHTALGETVACGAEVGVHGEFAAVPARDECGALRPTADIEEELDAIVLDAAMSGQRALLTVADVSKTGLISPGLGVVLALARRFPKTLEVLVDACQFRLAPETLRAYLDHGFMVGVTGSKFLTGPTFSGALFVPESVGARLNSRLLPPGLRAYSARADWPAQWVAGAGMSEAANYGLLLRWEAALAELSAFRALPPAAVKTFMEAFATAIQARLADDPAFEPLATRKLSRAAIGAPASWDRTPSIFPFVLRGRGGGYLSLAETQAVYRSLASAGARLGQPVRCGVRDGAPASALRLCNSARLVVEALSEGGDPEAVIATALGVLDRAAAAASADGARS
ncbi:MAG TPA: hypothetical protein VHZ26_14000 [Caulobacteraceae bacterium]|jgi:hypothetical protein|nr:hypothetical protein [Caulobacteraceae bacterium]